MAKQHGVEHLAGPQGKVLIYLGNNKDKEIFVKDIEAQLKVSKSVASNLVKRMEKNGFIETIPSSTDKRFKQVVMTDLAL
ncbi:MarR family transcriptional regulator, partial [Streptococcus pyogenes]